MENNSQKNIYKEILKLIFIYVILHIVLTIIFLIIFFVSSLCNISISHPFALLYKHGNTWLYIIFSSLLQSFIYFILGLLNAKLLNISNEKKAIIPACGACAFFQILSWVYMLILAFPGNEGLLFAILLNPFVFWSMNGIVNIADFRSILTLLYYILPTAAFFYGVYMNNKLLKLIKRTPNKRF